MKRILIAWYLVSCFDRRDLRGWRSGWRSHLFVGRDHGRARRGFGLQRLDWSWRRRLGSRHGGWPWRLVLELGRRECRPGRWHSDRHRLRRWRWIHAPLSRTRPPLLRKGWGFSLFGMRAFDESLFLILIQSLGDHGRFRRFAPHRRRSPHRRRQRRGHTASGRRQRHRRHAHACDVHIGRPGQSFRDRFRHSAAAGTSGNGLVRAPAVRWHGGVGRQRHWGGGGFRGGQCLPWSHHQAIGISPGSSPTLERSRRSLSKSAARR